MRQGQGAGILAGRNLPCLRSRETRTPSGVSHKNVFNSPLSWASRKPTASKRLAAAAAAAAAAAPLSLASRLPPPVHIAIYSTPCYGPIQADAAAGCEEDAQTAHESDNPDAQVNVSSPSCHRRLHLVSSRARPNQP
ncbi:hypothetical protein A7C99_0934 [Trichophyton rubrum]|uniref:Uncharacterized protein n=1 Tax=Trichophyton rubrum TaxID=5551 RepID=A0A178F8A3_TRIRU|nr:hypothetical protein HL42_4371 [Trichophyton rubrum]OAL67803.1 hypothetical protein A7C99_0934 [Trichophyton rubrum]